MVTDESELMASNVALSDTDKCLIRSQMVTTQREIEILDEEISRLQSVRASKFARVANLKAMISPIRELPSETIAEIFSKCASDSVTIKFPMDDDLSLEPWNLSQVCSRWREVAFAIPELWNDAHIVYNMPRARDLAILTQRLALHCQIKSYGLPASRLVHLLLPRCELACTLPARHLHFCACKPTPVQNCKQRAE